MARIRSVHPGQWTDAKFVRCSPLARLLALALRNEADDQGVFVWEPVDLKIRLLPMDAVDVDALLTELEAHDQVRKYEVAGRHYGAIRNFGVYQRPKFPKEVHPITDDIRSYATPSRVATVKDGDDDGAFPRNEERAPQRERREVKEEVKGKKEPNGSSGLARSERDPAAHLPADWKPDDALREYAAKLGLSPADIERDAVKFVAYFTEGDGSGQRRKAKGWRSSWHRWVAKTADKLPPMPRAGSALLAAPAPGTAEYYAQNPHLKPSW